MKTILALCAATLIGLSIFLWQRFHLPNEFGQFTGAPHAEVQELIDHPEQNLHKLLHIEGIVRKQCTTMGCYFFFQPGDKMLRVDLADIAMNAPRKNGHYAEVEGQVVPYGQGEYQFMASAIKFGERKLK